MSTATETQNIYQAINAVMREVGAIGKDRVNPQQRYNFRGIDDVYNALHPLLAKHGIVIVPEVRNCKREERQTKSGGVMIYTTMRVRFTFTALDGSSITVTTIGEAMDSGDKSANKAMSAAMKYACIQVFAIPTEEDNDTENHTHELSARQPFNTERANNQRQQQNTPPQQQQASATIGKLCVRWCTKSKKQQDAAAKREFWSWATSVVGRPSMTMAEVNTLTQADFDAILKAIDTIDANTSKTLEVQIESIRHVTPPDGHDSVKAGNDIVPEMWVIRTDQGVFGCIDKDVFATAEDALAGQQRARVTYHHDGVGNRITAVEVLAD